MRALVFFAAVLASAPAPAQVAIGGTFAANFLKFDEFGVPTVRLQLELACALRCPPSAPDLHYRLTNVVSTYVQDASRGVGGAPSGFGTDASGRNVHDSEQFKAGVALNLVAKEASCHCGNAIGEGGFVDLAAPMTVIPPWVGVGSSPVVARRKWSPFVVATLNGTETVKVRVVGAGLDVNVTLSPADLRSTGGFIDVTPTATGTVMITATLQPYGVSHSTTVSVTSEPAGAVGGGEGSSAGIGGGGEGRGSNGCGAAPAALMLPLAVLCLLRRRVVLMMALTVGLGCSSNPGPGGSGGGSNAAAGGTASAGGGVGVGGGGGGVIGASGGGSGGGDAAGGGAPSTGGVGTFLRVGMADHFFASGADGTLHLVFAEGAAERVFYGSCRSRCSDPASWQMLQLISAVQQGTTVTGADGIGVDGTGRLHVLISGVAPPGRGNTNEQIYATCASSCGNAASWSLLDLSPVSVSNTIGTNSTFLVTSSGAVSFITAGRPARYVSCNSGCTTLSNWSAGDVLDGTALFAARDAAGVTHVMVGRGSTSAGDQLLNYARCASNCTQGASWLMSALGFLYTTGGYTTGFAVTSSGRVFMAYNQGVTVGGPADNRKLMVNSCSGAGCLDLNTWASFSLGVADEGKDGVTLAANGESLLMLSIDNTTLNARSCDGSCEAGASWSSATAVDSSAAISKVIAPDTGANCGSTFSSWYPNHPQIGLTKNGVVLTHNPYALVTCIGSGIKRLPPIGRIISTF